jgi:4-hydroxy-tetrahydrodipicolinate synthase
MTTLAAGVWGVLATPFTDDLSLDLDSLERLVGHYRRVGASGLVALGVLGEAARLDTTERQRVLEAVVDAAEELPVVAGISATATAPAVEEARRMSAAGASALMVLVSTSEAGVLAAHLSAISDASGLGVVLQDHPATTGIYAAPDALATAIAETGVVVALKAEAPPTATAIAALRTRIDVSIFGGLGGVSLLDELLAGASGAMTGFAFPEALVATVDAFREGGLRQAKAVYAPWLPLVLCEAQIPISLAIRKEILRRRGLIETARVRPPGVALPDVVSRALDEHLDDRIDHGVAVGALG